MRQQAGVRAVVLAGETDTGGAALWRPSPPPAGWSPATSAARRAVKGGGGGGKGDVAWPAKDPSGVDEAPAIARKAAGLAS